MKFLLLLILISCNKESKPNADYLCKQSVEQYEYSLLSLPTAFGYDICDIDLTLETCPCYNYKKLPLNCEINNKRFDAKIKNVEDNYKTMIKLLKEKSADGVKKEMESIKNDLDLELKHLKDNQKQYNKLCRENEGIYEDI